jgi:DNA-binding winged helix-turn-helix (wHTH) protein/tetratricopeptide (TPR) repeat protein
MSLTANTVYHFENCVLDPSRRTLECRESQVALNPKTFDLLLYLVSHAGRVATKEELLTALWPDSFVEEQNLSQHVFLLRKALAENRLGERLVITVPGRGYQFAGRVQESPEVLGIAAPASGGEVLLRAVQSTTTVVVEEESDVPRQASLPALTATVLRHPLRWFAALCVVLLSAAGAEWYFGAHRAQPVLRKVVLADFDNRTGEAIFDDSLQSGLRIEMEQSPYIDLMSRSAVRETLATMNKPPDSPLVGDVAREVCERGNNQILLSGSIARIGSQFLLALEADSCANGSTVAAEKADVRSDNDVLAAMDSLTRRIRRELGESRHQIAEFHVPLYQATTSSLEALKAYSAAGVAFNHGDEKTAQALLEHATALDPNFQAAWEGLAMAWYNRGDFSQAAALFRKAFDLRGLTTERERLTAEINYYAYALNDDESAIRSMRAFLDLYPQAGGTWSNLANIYTQLGEYPEAIEAGRHAMAVDSHATVSAEILARAYKRAGRFPEAKQTAQVAISNGRDAFGVHSILFQIAWAEADAEGIRAYSAWGSSGQNAYRALDDLGFASACSGHVEESLDNFSRSHIESLRGGDTDFADGALLDAAGVLVDLGEFSRAVPLLKKIHGDAGDPAGLALNWVEAGDVRPAQRFLESRNAEDQHNTIRVFHDVPLIQAELALRNHKPQDAIVVLEPARRYELRDFSVPWMRARAESDAGLLAAAAQDYRLILANQGVDPLAPVYYIAHLKLAEVLARQNEIAQARAEYQAFFAAWKNADPNLTMLQQATREYAALR